jgi:acetyl esterase/lipase
MTLGEDGKPLPVPTQEGAYLGCEPAQCVPGMVRAASPMAYVGPNTPPFLIQHGSHKTVPLMQSQKLFDALRAAHVPVDYATYGEGETDVAKRAMDKIAAFLAHTFPRKPIDRKPPRITNKALPY